MLTAKALVHGGASGANIDRSSSKRPKATAHDFGHLSELALACERAPCKIDAIIVDGHVHSGRSGHTDGAKPCDVASSSSADFIQGLSHAYVDNAGNTQLVPGWVPGAPPKGSSLSTMVLCPPRRQVPFLLPELALPSMRTMQPRGPLRPQ